jgi:hypothetical protein
VAPQVTADYTERMHAGWADGQRLDLHDEMMRLALATAGHTLVGVEDEASEVGEILDFSLRMFRYAVLPLGNLLEYTPLAWVRRRRRARKRMDELIVRIIAERRREPTDRADLLSMLIRTQDELGHTGGMSNRQLRDELVTLLLAPGGTRDHRQCAHVDVVSALATSGRRSEASRRARQRPWRSRPDAGRRAEARLHPHGARRVNAALPAGVDLGTRAGGGVRGWRVQVSGWHDGLHQSVPGAP